MTHSIRRLRGLRPYRITLLAIAALFAAPTALASGSLGFYESSQSPGAFLILGSPVSGEPVDVDFNGATGEGGGIFGMSAVGVFATGDLTIDGTGFSCQLAGCMINPEVFNGGTSFAVTGGDDLNGDFGFGGHLATLRITGTNGYLVVARGEYLDATGTSSSIGGIQKVDPTIIARVPEPSLGAGLAVGVLALAARRRAARRHDAG